MVCIHQLSGILKHMYAVVLCRVRLILDGRFYYEAATIAGCTVTLYLVDQICFL